MLNRLIFLGLSFGIIFSGDFENSPEREKSSLDKIVLSENLRAIILVEDERSFDSLDLTFSSGVILMGVSFPKNENIVLKKIERTFIDHPLFYETVEEIKSTIETIYEEAGQRGVKVIIPDQGLRDGIIRIIVKNVGNNNEKTPKVPDIRSILMISSELEDNQPTEESEGIMIKGLDIPDSKDLIRKLTVHFLNTPFSKENIGKIKDEIIIHYKENDRPVVAVNVPDQKITKGTLRLIITEARIGVIKVQGNKYFSDKEYLKYISQKNEDKISEKRLLNDLNFLNRNPFRVVDLIYEPGKNLGHTDLELFVRERRPIRFFYGSDNTGLTRLGDDRYYAGVHLGNLFWQSHVLSYQITKSYAPHAFEANTLQYTIPLPWKDLINIYGGYSRLKANIQALKSVKHHGRHSQASFRYDFLLPIFKDIIQDFIVGFDFKRLDNQIDFYRRTIPIYYGIANITQLVLSYIANYDRGPLQTSLDVNLYWSPGKWISDQSLKHYRSLRPLSKCDYFYGVGSWKTIIRLFKDFTWSFFVRAQLSNQNLLSSEMFGIGGYNSVRGYNEYEYIGDNGVCISTEFRTPPLGLFKYIFSQKIPDTFQIVLFVDFGKAWLNRQLSELKHFIKSKRTFCGCGPGLRYVISPCFALRLDLGYKLKRSANDQEKKKIHFGANLSF